MPTKKITPNQDWMFKDKIRKIIEKNCEEVPYEGTDVNKSGIIDDICELLSSKEYSLLKHTKSQ